MITNLAPSRCARLAIRLAALAAVCLIAGAAPAAAHGGAALIEVGEPEPAGELTVTFPVRITYEGDGHAVEEVEGLTVSGKGPDGAELEAVEAFAPGDAPGVFVATVTLPVEGTWELAIASVEPPVNATLTAEVSGPETATTDGPADEGPTATAPDDPGDAPGSAPEGAGDTGSGEEPAEDTEAGAEGDDTDGDSDDGGGIPIYAIVIAVIVAAGAAVVGYRWSTSRA